MKYINVSTLKRQAKKIRKNNLNIKNHAESLNLVAKEYNFETWEELLDKTVLLIEDNDNNKTDNKKETPEEIIKIVINNISDRLEYFNDIISSGDYNYLAAKIHEICLSKSNSDEEFKLFQDRGFLLIKAICFVFYKTTKNITDYKYLHSLLNRNILMNIIEENFNEFMKYSVISNFIETLISYEIPTPYNPNPQHNETMIEHYGYLTMQYSARFSILIEEIEVFKNIDKHSIAEELKNPKPCLTYSIYLDKERYFVEYIRTLFGKDVSFYNKEFKEKNISILNKITKKAF